MGRLIRFEERSARYARVDLESLDPIWISVSRAGVAVKRSRLGFFGQAIYSEGDLKTVVAHCRELDKLFLAPSGPVSDPVLAPFTAAALSSRNVTALEVLLAVPDLLTSGYRSERSFGLLQRFTQEHGAFIERASGWNLGWSEDLLPLPARTLAELLLIYALAVVARDALVPEAQMVIRFAYGHLALALPADEGRDSMSFAERLTVGQPVDDPKSKRILTSGAAALERQTAREREFDRRLAEICGSDRVEDFSNLEMSSDS